jgi:hypothetical protein
MITHNNFNYSITYILFTCIGHEEVLLQFQQTLAPSLGAHCSKTGNILLNISNISRVTVEVSFQLRTPRDDAQGTVICRLPRVQSKKESHAISCSLE